MFRSSRGDQIASVTRPTALAVGQDRPRLASSNSIAVAGELDADQLAATRPPPDPAQRVLADVVGLLVQLHQALQALTSNGLFSRVMSEL